MADKEPRFVPGFQGKEPASLNELVYVEADVQLHRGDEAYHDQFGVAFPLPEAYKVGPYKSPIVIWEDIPKGQFGYALRSGSFAAHKEAMKARAQAKAQQVIDTQSTIAQPGELRSQTRKVPVKK